MRWDRGYRDDGYRLIEKDYLEREDGSYVYLA